MFVSPAWAQGAGGGGLGGGGEGISVERALLRCLRRSDAVATEFFPLRKRGVTPSAGTCATRLTESK